MAPADAWPMALKRIDFPKLLSLSGVCPETEETTERVFGELRRAPHLASLDFRGPLATPDVPARQLAPLLSVMAPQLRSLRLAEEPDSVFQRRLLLVVTHCWLE